MKFLQGKDRQQVEFYTQSIDETIGVDNEVRLIDAFVSSLPSLEPFCRTQKKQLQNSLTKFSSGTIDLIAN